MRIHRFIVHVSEDDNVRQFFDSRVVDQADNMISNFGSAADQER